MGALARRPPVLRASSASSATPVSIRTGEAHRALAVGGDERITNVTSSRRTRLLSPWRRCGSCLEWTGTTGTPVAVGQVRSAAAMPGPHPSGPASALGEDEQAPALAMSSAPIRRSARHLRALDRERAHRQRDAADV